MCVYVSVYCVNVWHIHVCVCVSVCEGDMLTCNPKTGDGRCQFFSVIWNALMCLCWLPRRLQGLTFFSFSQCWSCRHVSPTFYVAADELSLSPSLFMASPLATKPPPHSLFFAFCFVFFFLFPIIHCPEFWSLSVYPATTLLAYCLELVQPFTPEKIVPLLL